MKKIKFILAVMAFVSALTFNILSEKQSKSVLNINSVEANEPIALGYVLGDYDCPSGGGSYKACWYGDGMCRIGAQTLCN